MCGIFAVFGLVDGSEKWRGTVVGLSKLLRHRGPDWNGITCFRSAILAHERLAVVGLSSGAQPILSADGASCLSVNGEIYNHRELEKELDENVQFSTDSDCEVLLHLFRERGPSFLETTRVCGMFSFACYDSRSDALVVARDPVGIIPLYVGWGKEGSVWFASEMKALQGCCDHYEAFPPGHYYVGRSDHHPEGEGEIGKMKPFCSQKWFLDQDYLPPPSSVDLNEFRHQLTSSVRRHLLSEVPYGLLLSGGLDSSLIAAIACRECKSLGNGVGDGRLRSFCIGLDGSPDLAAAERVAKHIGTRHYSFTFTIQQGLDALSDVIYHLETFDVTTVRASTPMFLLARRVKATGCKMVLSGEGADEVFGGYLYFHRAPDREEFHRETVRKLRDLNRFDCLRANKSTMAWGVEARVPFLDQQFLEYAMEIDPSEKMCGKGTIEKKILRQAFDDKEDPYLPSEVLWRQKEQFSDGVGYGWIDALRDHASEQVSDLQMRFASNRFSVCPPETKEAYLYREIFSKHFPSPSAAKTVPQGKSIACSTEAALRWDSSFRGTADPSGRSVAGVHVEAYDGAGARQ